MNLFLLYPLMGKNGIIAGVMTSLNAMGRRLAAGLAQAKRLREQDQIRRDKQERINVVGTGGTLTAAYEQLRNAAENSEEHLLLQNAIKRFYRQIFMVHDDALLGDSGNELIIELTFAGYMPNDSLTKAQAVAITELALQHYQAYQELQKHRSLKDNKALSWTVDVLAVEVAAIVRPRYEDVAFCEFAYEYFVATIPGSMVKKSKDFGAALYVAIQRALLRSDAAGMRANLLRRYGVSAAQVDAFLEFNRRIDTLIDSPTTDKLYHTVDRQGAPLRVLRRMITGEDDVSELLTKQNSFLSAFEQQVKREYQRISTRINRAVVRSVIFLIITKVLIGVAVEVPYDMLTHGGIVWLPLIINLLFPPLYMIALRLTLTMPGRANTTALIDRIDNMLYGGEVVTFTKAHLGQKRYGATFSVVYGVLSLIVLAVVAWLLIQLQFSFVHIVIFILFISAASFLSFRLGHLVRELEIVRSQTNGVTMLRDFIYLPFVVIGQWMSDKYSKLNIVTMILDVIIEMPLKTILRLLRQWNAFIDERKDDLS